MWTHAEQSAFENLEDPESDPSLCPQSSLWHFRSLDAIQTEVAALLFEIPVTAPPFPAPRNKVWKPKRDIYARAVQRKPKTVPWVAKSKLPFGPEWEPIDPDARLGPPVDPEAVTDSVGRWALRPIGNGNYIFKKCGGRWIAKWSVTGISVRMVMLPVDIWVRVIKKILTKGFTQLSPGTYQKDTITIRTMNHLNDVRWFFLEACRSKNPNPLPVKRPVRFHKVYRFLASPC